MKTASYKLIALIFIFGIQAFAENECDMGALSWDKNWILSKEYGSCAITKAKTYECYCSHDSADDWASKRHGFNYIPPLPNADGCFAHKWREIEPTFFVFQKDATGDYSYYMKLVKSSNEAIKLVEKCNKEIDPNYILANTSSKTSEGSNLNRKAK